MLDALPRAGARAGMTNPGQPARPSASIRRRTVGPRKVVAGEQGRELASVFRPAVGDASVSAVLCLALWADRVFPDPSRTTRQFGPSPATWSSASALGRVEHVQLSKLRRRTGVCVRRCIVGSYRPDVLLGGQRSVVGSHAQWAARYASISLNAAPTAGSVSTALPASDAAKATLS